MTIEERIEAFTILGAKINDNLKAGMENLCTRARSENAWFTSQSVELAFQGIELMLRREKLDKWLSKYSLTPKLPRIIGIVMAGNIPLVGFHDLMCVLLSGHFAAIKTSSQDSYLPRLVVEWLVEIEPRFKKNIEFRERLTSVDAVIATGSDNTARYFEYYFRNIPNIIRKNRTSIAILDGTESREEIQKLGKDIFHYFGLGCRNVSKLLIPKGYDAKNFFEALDSYKEVINHHKYCNNYDYYKSIYLINSTPHLDNGFLLWLPSEELVSPISVIYVQEMDNPASIKEYIALNEEKIQCVVGKDQEIPFGHAQTPGPWDYADKKDTLSFLGQL